MKRLLVIGIILLFLFCNISFTTLSDENSGNLSGKTLYVGGSGPGNYTKIQDAIDDASEGDTVLVYSGIYKEVINFDKSLSLIGEDKNTTIIHGYIPGAEDEEEFPLIVLYPIDGATISGFTLENATGSIMAYSMYHNSANNCSISDIIFKTRRGMYGLDIFLEGSTNMKIHDNIFNSGLLIYESYNNTIENNIIHGKPLVYLENKSNVTISYAGQVVLNRCENITLKNLEISDTHSGILLFESDYTYVYNCILSNNYYGIELRSENNLIEQNTIESNEYGILLQSNKKNIFFHNNFINNFEHLSGVFSNKNIWYDSVTKSGNYWDDYKQKTQGANRLWLKGVWGTPYVISESVQDNYPLIVPYKTSNIFLNYLYYLIDVIWDYFNNH